jgi:4-nitrophenyl phosphatase
VNLNPQTIEKLIDRILTQEAKAISDLSDQLDPDLITQAIQILLETRGMILVSGAGTSSSIARRMAHVLTCSGVRAVYLDAGQAQHGYSAIISKDDVLIAFSRGGETREVNHLLEIAQQRGAASIGILEATDTSMAALCDLVLMGSVSQENDAGGVIPLASTLVHAAIGDILCAAVLETHGLSEREFAQVHPGGAVGLRLSERQEQASLSMIKGVILDMDGVLWHGEEPLEGIQAFFSALKDLGIRYVLATNNPSKHPHGFAEKARGFGIKIEDEDVITSVVATVHYLKEHIPGGSRVHVIGEEALKEQVAGAGYQIVDEDVVAVIAALERGLTYETIKRGALLIRAGAIFIGTNGDHSYPTEEGIVPGSGMMVTALAASADQEPIIMGKPERPIFDLALEKLGVPADQVASVGDRLDSDILGGQRAGLHTILLFTGITTPEMLRGSPIQPTWTYADLPALTKALRAS